MQGLFEPLEHLYKLLKDEIKDLSNDVKGIIPKIYQTSKVDNSEEVFDYIVEMFDIVYDDTKYIINEMEYFRRNGEDSDENRKHHLKKLLKLNDNQDYINEKGSLIQNVINNLVILHTIKQFEKLAQINIDEIESYDDFINLSNKGEYWYRGQSDFRWNMVPSYYRSLRKKSNVNYHTLISDYSSLRISNKIEKVFRHPNMNYEEIAFIQHSISMTPFLDFTRDPKTAISFAISNFSTPRKLNEDDAAVYQLKINGDTIITDPIKATNIIKNLDVEYFNSKPYVSTLIKSSFWKDLLTGKRYSEYHLIDIKTNDRMRFQDGTFVLFNNVMFIDDIMVVSHKKHRKLSSLITKYKISDKVRYAFHEKINDGESLYHILMMLNPYDYMIE